MSGPLCLPPFRADGAGQRWRASQPCFPNIREDGGAVISRGVRVNEGRRGTPTLFPGRRMAEITFATSLIRLRSPTALCTMPAVRKRPYGPWVPGPSRIVAGRLGKVHPKAYGCRSPGCPCGWGVVFCPGRVGETNSDAGINRTNRNPTARSYDG